MQKFQDKYKYSLLIASSNKSDGLCIKFDRHTPPNDWSAQQEEVSLFNFNEKNTPIGNA